MILQNNGKHRIKVQENGEEALLREDPKINKKEMYNMRLNRWEIVPNISFSKDYNVKLNTQNAIEMLLHRIYSTTHIKQVDVRTIMIIIIIFTIIMLILLAGLSAYVFITSNKQKKELDSLKKELDNNSNTVK